MPNVYLTIDDSPCTNTTRLFDALHERGVPALVFCRGDALEENPTPVIRAIKQGFVMANHGYRHKPAVELGYHKVTQGITQTESLLDMCYAKAGVTRKHKYFRFPYIDRGDGDRIERRFFEFIANPTDIPLTPNVMEIQNFLEHHGFTQPFLNVTHPLYKVPAIANAYDCLFTYSTGDWMLNARHKGTQPLQTLADLTATLDADPYLLHEAGNQIVLIHDQPEITDTVIALVDHMLSHNVNFLPVRA